MGKARILSAQGEGLYSIEILEDRTRAEAARTTAVQRVAQLDARITDFEADLADAQSAVDAAVADQDQAIADYQAALQDDAIDTAAARQAMTDAGEAVLQAATQRDGVRGAIRAAKAERLTLQARIERIDALPALRQVSAWCADYVEDLSGEVATAEVPGEIGQVIIQPGFDDGAAWSPSEDGAIQPSLSGTPASVFYNLAMLPGWQKWRPTFRLATVSNISNDLCDITLDPAASSQQGLNVNAQSSYSGVPIMYMDCNGDAFEDGDKVLVAFSGNTNQPMVVGFESEPKECYESVLAITATPHNARWPGDENIIMADGAGFYEKRKARLESGKYAVRVFNLYAGENDGDLFKYRPEWGYPRDIVAVNDPDFPVSPKYDTGARYVEMEDWLSAYESAVEGNGGQAFKNVVVVANYNAYPNLYVQDELEPELIARGVENVTIIVDVVYNWVKWIKPYFPT